MILDTLPPAREIRAENERKRRADPDCDDCKGTGTKYRHWDDAPMECHCVGER